MAKKKFSQFNAKSKAVIADPLVLSYHFLVGHEEFTDQNFKVPFGDLIPTLASLGGGTSLVGALPSTNSNELKLKSLTSVSGKLTITNTANTVDLTIPSGAIAFSDLTGTNSLSAGGTGNDLSVTPAQRAFIMHDNVASERRWATFNSSDFYWSVDQLRINPVSPLTTKGDLYTFTTGNARLAVGTNGQVLSANSATATGLEWITLPAVSDIGKVQVDSLATADYIGPDSISGVIRTTNKLSKADGGNFVTMSVNENNLDLDLLINTTARAIKYHTLAEDLATGIYFINADKTANQGLFFTPSNAMVYQHLTTVSGTPSFEIRTAISGGLASFGPTQRITAWTNFVANNDILGQIIITSADQSAVGPGGEAADTVDGGAVIRVRATQNHSNTARGSKFQFLTKTNGTLPSAAATLRAEVGDEVTLFTTLKFDGYASWELRDVAGTGSYTSANRKIAVEVAGVVYYLLADTVL